MVEGQQRTGGPRRSGHRAQTQLLQTKQESTPRGSSPPCVQLKDGCVHLVVRHGAGH